MADKNSKFEVHFDPLWYKDAIIYEAHVRAFFDSNADGYGDFRGLTEKLDYLQDLGITALWLLPFYPSPLRDDGYDIADYRNVHPRYGTLHDFRSMLRAAHHRGIQVICELVVNHTSDQHPWFQRARRAKPGSTTRDYYVWSDTTERYADARIIFKDYEPSNWTWDDQAQAYYWHRFFSHQPDLNFENPRVRRSIFQTLDFWLDMGVAGMRLDAVPYLYEEDGTICENLPQTHAFLAELRRHIDRKYGDRMLLAEANQWPEDAAQYLGDGAGCHMAFHFPLMPRMFMAIQLEDRFPIIDILQQTPEIPEACQWALFLRNHDELTLEMVTDEERDYMYRTYAHETQARINLGIRRRLAPLLGHSRRRIELMYGLLLSLPGTPVIYYGDEIGMGDNFYLGDRDAVRTPMQWSADRNGGFSRANPQQLYLPLISDPEYRYEAVNVETQQRNPHSMLWWMKRIIALRKQHRPFSRGTMEMLQPENRKVLAFIRRHEDETLLVVANLSRFVQYVELDLGEFSGMTPVEIFGRTEFPRIGDLRYFVTLGPHSFYWFLLEAPESRVEARPGEPSLVTIRVAGSWESVLEGVARGTLEAQLPRFLKTCRWFGGKARKIKEAVIRQTIPLTSSDLQSMLAMVEVGYTDADSETYLLPLTFSTGERSEVITHHHRSMALARLIVRDRHGAEQEGVLHDATGERPFALALLDAIARRRHFRGTGGTLKCRPNRALRPLLAAQTGPLEPAPMRGEQSNSSIIFGDQLILKLFRKLESGVNPDLEIGRFLTEQKKFAHVPPVLGSIEYEDDSQANASLAILQGFVANEGDAWGYTLDVLGHFFEHLLAARETFEEAIPDRLDLLEPGTSEEPDQGPSALIGPYLDQAGLLGRRTAEMHCALAAADNDPAFVPESFTPHYQRSLYQSMRNLSGQIFQLLRRRLPDLDEPALSLARQVSEREEHVLSAFRLILDRRIGAKRIRTHGDYHLGQVLFTGRDFVILDFEGEPARSLSERRLKRASLRDVAGMLRSFHYAVWTASRRFIDNGMVAEDRRSGFERWARFWYERVSACFLDEYLSVGEGGGFLPRSREELRILLDAYLLEKAIYELGYELNNRPNWIDIPLHGILSLLGKAGSTG